MAKNEFLPFGTAEGANVLSNQEYEALAARHNGFNSGVAKSKELNKVWRQASLIASAVAQFIVDTDQKDLLDTGDVADIKSRLASAINLIISNGDYVTNPYLKLELLKKIDKADIAQQLGNDPNKVGSLLLLTEQLGKKASVADVNGKLTKDQNGADIQDKEKFIENLGLPELFQPKGEYAANNGAGIVASEFRSHLQLGDAARRYVGNNPNDLPDMSFFKTVSGGFSLPQGIQFRFGTVSGDGYKSFNVPFPTACHTVVFGQTFGPNAWVLSPMYKNLTKSGFELAVRAYSGVSGIQIVSESVSYLAIGN